MECILTLSPCPHPLQLLTTHGRGGSAPGGSHCGVHHHNLKHHSKGWAPVVHMVLEGIIENEGLTLHPWPRLAVHCEEGAGVTGASRAIVHRHQQPQMELDLACSRPTETGITC